MVIPLNSKSTCGYTMGGGGKNSPPPHLYALRATVWGTPRVGQSLGILQPTCTNSCPPPHHLPQAIEQGCVQATLGQLLHQGAANKHLLMGPLTVQQSPPNPGDP